MGKMVFNNEIRRRLPDFLSSINLKYVKLGYWYCSAAHETMLLFLFMITVFASVVHFGAKVATSAVLFAVTIFYWRRSRLKEVYLVDFSCHKAEDERKMSVEGFLKMTEESSAFAEESLQFQRKISTRSGLGDETYLSRGITSRPPNLSMEEARAEAEYVMFGAMDALLEKTNVSVDDIGILIVNCSLFNPTPSLASLIVNHYRMRADVKTFNLGGMGCSAGVIAVDLAKHLLQANPNSYAVVLSMENITLNWYFGNDRSMLLCNCIFRMGGAAVLLSNHPAEKVRAKYRLVDTVRTHKGAEETSYKCVYQREDTEGRVGVSLARELMAVAGDALKTNITTLGPLVLPLKEQLKFFSTLVQRKVLRAKVKPYIPDFGLAFEHFCIHAGGRAVLDEIEKNLSLSEWHMQPSRMTLHRFGNTSSSSLWYELAYMEAAGRVTRGHRVWQIAFGSGFKCNSAIWKALRDVSVEECKHGKCNPWVDSIHKYPLSISSMT